MFIVRGRMGVGKLGWLGGRRGVEEGRAGSEAWMGRRQGRGEAGRCGAAVGCSPPLT